MLLVFAHHATLLVVDGAWSNVQVLLSRLGGPGRFGVDIFFVLSGFLITSILIRDRESTSYYHDFYWKRALRILPLYGLTVLLLFVFIPHSASFLAMALLFVVNLASVIKVTLSVPTPFWTLAVEEQFYILWPTIVRKRSVSSLARVAVALAILSFLLRCLFAFKGHHNYHLTFLRCDALALGAFLACYFAEHRRRTLPPRSANRWLLLAGVAGIVSCIAAAFFGPGQQGQAWSANFEQTGVTLISMAFIGLLILYTRTRALAFFRSPLLTFFGLISYAFYMVHLFVLHLYDKFVGAQVPGATGAYFLRMGAVFAMTILLSLASRYGIELPALSLRRFVLNRPAVPAESERPLIPAEQEAIPADQEAMPAEHEAGRAGRRPEGAF